MSEREPLWKREEQAFAAWWQANQRQVAETPGAFRDVAQAAAGAADAMRATAQACQPGGVGR